MNDTEFKLKVVEDIATIKNDVAHIKENIPTCEKDTLRAKIRNNRALIWMIFTLLMGLSIRNILASL